MSFNSYIFLCNGKVTDNLKPWNCGKVWEILEKSSGYTYGSKYGFRICWKGHRGKHFGLGHLVNFGNEVFVFYLHDEFLF